MFCTEPCCARDREVFTIGDRVRVTIPRYPYAGRTGVVQETFVQTPSRIRCYRIRFEDLPETERQEDWWADAKDVERSYS